MSHNARRCPKCEQVNHGGAEFCQTCAENIRQVTPEFLPWAQSRKLPPIAAAVYDQGRRFARLDPDAAGSGLVWTGVAIAAAGLLLDLTPTILLLLVGIGATLSIMGLWQLRTDYPAMTRLGAWLVGVSLLVLGVVVWRVVEPGSAQPANIPVQVEQEPEDSVAVAGDGNVLMSRGGASHTGLNPGPSPKGSLFRSWRFDTGGELYSSPAVSDNTLVVGSKSGYLYGLNATTGEQIWARDLGQYIVRSSPAISDRTIVINNGYQVIALSIEDGTTLWTQDISFAGDTSPTISGPLVFVTSQAGGIVAMDLATGEQRWRAQLDGLMFGAPTVDEGRLYVANDRGKVTAMTAENGSILWTFEANGGVFAPIIGAKEFVMLSTNAGVTYTLHAKTGKIAWQYDAGGSSGGAATLNQLVVAADNGGVSGLRRQDGELVWLVPTGAPITVGPTIVGDLVYIASGQTLYGFSVADGSLAFTYATGYTIQTAPVVVNGTIYIGGRDGYLDAIVGDAT